jgi:regulatory protein
MKSECKYSFLEAKAKLEALCAYQERCQFELEQKLISWGFKEEDRNALLADLITNRFLDEERFAIAFVSGKYRIKLWGRIKIRSHMKLKRISEHSIKKGLSQIDPDEYWETVLQLAEKKLADLGSPEDRWQQKVKIIRYLQSRGFEMDLSQDAADQVLSTAR